ncbi:MAG: UDP-N-acetylglucosamine 2-epimerase (non-hydrolyzing) [Brevinematales bacterium]|nr:UDP-N-acetylglucosamine 2-epimerase (non-hydrolyzing) [Brevinematales bacterium]
MKKVLFIFGTRPEAIKMAPLIKAFGGRKEQFVTEVCVTAQHREMLDQVLDFFGIEPHFDLNLMKPNQTLFDITADSLKGLEDVLDRVHPDMIFVQGDTTTAFVGALAGYYKKIKVAHIEAGLRSGNKFSPFPEEMNRILAGRVADFHFAPTPLAEKNLRGEAINDNIHVVGNTVIDALFLGLDIIKQRGDGEYAKFYSFLDFNKRVILVTGHRRESFGKPFEAICGALKRIADRGDVSIVYPVHLNPNVQEPVKRILKDVHNVHLIPPVDYPKLIWLLNRSYLVLTDSGGIQEEAPSLGKPVLVMREVTERTEGVDAGTAMLVGTDEDLIVREATKLLDIPAEYEKMAHAANPYGDGTTSSKVVDIVGKYFEGIVG